MTVTNSSQTTPGAVLRCVSGVDFDHQDSTLFSIGVNPGCQSSSSPLRESTLNALLGLHLLGYFWNFQIFQNNNRIFGTPTDKLLSNGLTEGFSPVRLLTSKPFEKTAYRSGISLLCLAARKFSLESLFGLPGLGIGDAVGNPRDKQFLVISIYSHKNVCLIKIDADGGNPFRIRRKGLKYSGTV